MWRWLCSCRSRRFRCSGLRRSCRCSSLRLGFRMRSRLSCGCRFRGGGWCGLLPRLRMSRGLCTWRRMRRCSGLISRLRRLGRPRCGLCCSGRVSNIRLRPRTGFGGNSAMLQLGDVCSRTRYCGMGGNSMIHRSKIGLILFRDLLMLLLRRSRRKMTLAGEGLLLGCRFRRNSIRTTVEARVGVVDDRRILDDRRIDVGRPNHGGVHAHCRCVVSEDSTAPLTAGKAASTITKAIVHAAVEADLCPPIAGMEDIHTAISPAPITRCPEIAGLRSEDPGTRDPIVVANAIPRPIARCPQVIGQRAGRLNVNRERGRFDINADAD